MKHKSSKPAHPEALLETRGLIKTYSRRRVVDGVSFHVMPGEIVGLLGPNGAGKTTSFRMTVGLVSPDGGAVWMNGKECSRLPMYKRARLGMGYLPQEASIFRRLSVRQNMLAVLESMPLSRRERHLRADAILDELDMRRLSKSIAETLSGGERRRLEICRALASRPSILLLDEPFAGVDPIAVEEIQVLVRGLRERGIGVLITDHNVRETLNSTDRAYIIHQGHILKEGTADVLISDPEVRRVYLGNTFDARPTGVSSEEEHELG